jgi:endonuclease-8
MPEGDTIFRTARTLHRALAGKTVTRFESMLPGLTRVHDDTPVTGRMVDVVTPAGKHLLMALSGNLVLRTHMRMNGSWHIYRPGERWHRAQRDMRIVLATRDYVAVGFNIPVAEWLKTSAIERHEEPRRLGPDLLAEGFDAEVADALVNQRVMAGIGNVYKSEVLFVCRVNPFTVVGSLADEQVRCLVTMARKFLRANVMEGLAPMTTYLGYRRTTRRDQPGQRLWVYGRADEPCRRCATPVKMAKQGRDARLTYWCPTCQG